MIEKKAMTKGQKLTAVLALLAILAAYSGTALAQALETDVQVTWKSRYVSEGRDNLDGKAIVETMAEITFDFLTLGASFGINPDIPYRELNAYLLAGGTWGDIDAYVSYTHLRYLSDREHDNEIGAGIAYTALPLGLSLGADGYYSFDTRGAFFELTLGGEYEIFDRLALSPFGTMGFNAGYIDDGHDGANHVATGIEIKWQITESFRLVSGIAHTWKISADADRYPGDESLGNFAHGWISLGFSF